MDGLFLGYLLIGCASLTVIVTLSALLYKTHLKQGALARALDNSRDALKQLEIECSNALIRVQALDEVKDNALRERERRERAEAEIIRLKTNLDVREAAMVEERQRLTDVSQKMQDRFKALASEALNASSEKLQKQAEQSFKLHNEITKGGVKTLVEPMQQRLEQFRVQVEKMERDRVGDSGSLKSQIAELSKGLIDQHKETSKLVNALQRSPTTRGRWGERTVENILELAGLTKGIDYQAQVHTSDSHGSAWRPDFIIRLPGGGCFVVDSKVALTAFLDAVEAVDETERKQALERHAKQVKDHVRELAKKDYAKSVDGAIDFVALFIPGESFYSAAMEQAPDLFDEAIKANIIITTPATLLALAKAVAYGFRQEKLEQNALEIARIGEELHDRIAKFTDYLGKVGVNIGRAAKAYNEAVGSFQGRILPSARKIADLNRKTRIIHAPEPVDETPRLIVKSDEI